MKVHLLKCASMCPMSGLLPKSVFPALTCNCLLIETSAGLVLVDTGFGKEDMADQSRLGPLSKVIGLKANVEDTAFQQITRLGLSPSDVTHVIPTHLDPDHAGGLPDFPNATVHILESELEAALTPSNLKQKKRYLSVHWKHQPNWQPYDLNSGDTWNGFQRVKQLKGLPPEILLVALPGHSLGHAGIAISTESGWLLHAGDAYYDRRQLERRAKITPGMRLFERFADEKFKLASETRTRLRDIVLSNPEIHSICSHDEESL